MVVSVRNGYLRFLIITIIENINKESVHTVNIINKKGCGTRPAAAGAVEGPGLSITTSFFEGQAALTMN